MSSISIVENSKKYLLYIVIFLFIVFLNFLTNQKYKLISLDFNIPSLAEGSFQQVAMVEPELYRKRVFIKRGETIDVLLKNQDISLQEILASSRALASVFNPRDLRADSQVILAFNWGDKSIFMGYEIYLSHDKAISVAKNEYGEFIASLIEREYAIKQVSSSGVIEDSLYQSAVRYGLTPNVVMNLIDLYSFDVDFQRDIHEGARFKVIYEEFYSESGELIRNGNILAAELELKDRTLPIYRYTAVDGKTDYFNKEGKSARKSLLRTPINGAYVTSSFGMRIHPIYGYNAVHRGIDFGARTGTPIMASGDGVITRVLVHQKGYGKHVMIRHPNGYETLYGHMSAFAKGMAVGTRVSQGQIIGYVGSTGDSTGPHLHYETRYNGQFVNPANIKIPPGRTLLGDDLILFNKLVQDFSLEY